MPEVPAEVTPKEFLQTIWGEQEGICSVAFAKADPKNPLKTKGFWEVPLNYPAELDKLVNQIPPASGKLHVYFGVCLKKEKWPRKNSKGETEKRGTKENALSATCIWADVDFKTTPVAQAVKNLKEFPLKVSIGILSGGGIQAYWLLKEPATEPDELKLVESINRRLSKVLGGDHTQDTARVLRVPGTINIKYPKPCTIAPGTWRPELQYNLDDFEKFLPIDTEPEVEVPPDVAATQVPGAGAVTQVDVGSLNISDVAKKVIREGLPAYVEFRRATDAADKFKERQENNQLSRSEGDAWVVSQLLGARLSDAQIYAIYRNPANLIAEKYQERRDKDKYLGVTIQKMKKFIATHPRKAPTAGAEQVGRATNRTFQRRIFEITNVIQHDYEDPIYEVHTRTVASDETHVTKCALKEFANYDKFKEAFLAQNKQFPPFLTTNVRQQQVVWQTMVNAVTFEVKAVEKEVSTIQGEVQEALDEWMLQAQAEGTNATIQYFPVVKADDNRVFLKVPALMQFLTSQKVDVRKRQVTHALRQMGFKMDTQRFGGPAVKVWTKLLSNGSVPANGTPDESTEEAPGLPFEDAE